MDGSGWWTWNHRDVQGNELAASHKPFRYFQEALADARRNGFRDGECGSKKESRCFF